jgi:hypothetical protein
VKEDLSDSELREKLAAWRIEGELPRAWLRSLLISVTPVSVPRLALTGIAIGLLIGTTTGVVEASRWNAATWNRLEAKYVQSIDPYQRIHSS